MRVCLQGGRLDVTRALAEATAEDLAYWAAFEEMEPFGPLHDSRRAAVISLAALAPWCKKGETPRAERLFPELGQEREQSDAAMVAGWAAWTVAVGGEVHGVAGQDGSEVGG